MKFSYQVDGQIHTVDLVKTTTGYRVALNGQTYEALVVRSEPGELTLIMGDRPLTFHWAADGMDRWVAIDGKTFLLKSSSFVQGRERDKHRTSQARTGDKLLVAPMPGHVRAVQVKEGDSVSKGQTLILLEAMKMEIRIRAPRAGRLAKLLVKPEQAVERDQELGEIE